MSRPLEGRPPPSPLRVLLVEDVAADAVLVEQELRRAGIAFVSQRVQTKKAFLEALTAFAPDIVLSDYRLPQFDGLTALQLLQERAPMTPLILITGSLNEETAVECMKAGAADYVLKDRRARLGPAVTAALERRRMTEEGRRAAEALRRSEIKYRSLVENASYGIYRRDASGRFSTANRALVAILGYSGEDEILALSIREDVYVDAGQYDSLQERCAREQHIAGVEARWKRKDGTPITVRLSGRPVVEDGTLTYEMIADDITEQRRLEAQLRQAQKMEAIGQLTGGIAHDFNNVLTVISANSEIVSAMLPEEQTDLRAGLEDVRAAAHRGTAMIKKLMSFSRRAMLERRTIELPQLIADLTAVLHRLLPEHIEIHVASAPRIDPINADPGAVEQILINLATNARDAMPEGGTLSIVTQPTWLDEGYHATHPWCRPGPYVCVAVSDSGVGMDHATLQRVFEPFFTTKPPGVGTGLGMAMVYGLMKQHGGYINVYSEPGQGTKIKLYFPVGEAPRSPAPPVRREPAPRPGTETILVVEDEEAIRRATKRALESYGYTVLLAADGEEALETLRRGETRVDLIVSDLVMPKLGGRQLYEALKPAVGDVRFLFTSGYSPHEVGEGRPFAPEVPLLQKPWTLSDLLIRVREVLDGPTPREAV